MYLPIRLFVAVFALFLAACAKPAATPDPPEPPEVEPAEASPSDATAQEQAPLPVLPADGLRLPDNMLDLPGERDFRASNPSQAGRVSPGGGAVSSRPPTDPPSRVKETETEE